MQYPIWKCLTWGLQNLCIIPNWAPPLYATYLGTWSLPTSPSHLPVNCVWYCCNASFSTNSGLGEALQTNNNNNQSINQPFWLRSTIIMSANSGTCPYFAVLHKEKSALACSLAQCLQRELAHIFCGVHLIIHVLDPTVQVYLLLLSDDDGMASCS